MTYELTGKLVAIYDTVQRTETFKTREFAVEMSEDVNGKTYTSYAKFQCVQAKTGIVDSVSIGEEVKVYFNIKGSKYEKDGKENYITNLDAWRIELLSAGSQQTAPKVPASQEGFPMEVPELDDSLPF